MGDEDLRGRFRRDFSTEPIRPIRSHPQAQPQPQPASSPATQSQQIQPAHQAAHRKTKKRRKLPLLVILLVLLAAGAGGYWYWSAKLTDPIPAATRSAVDYPLLYPSKLPSGFSIDKNSFSVSGGNIVQFNAVSQSKGMISFTEQPKVANFDYDTFFQKGFQDSNQFVTPVGKAVIGKVMGSLKGMAVSDKTWVLVGTSSNKVTSNDLMTALSGLKLAD